LSTKQPNYLASGPLSETNRAFPAFCARLAARTDVASLAFPSHLPQKQAATSHLLESQSVFRRRRARGQKAKFFQGTCGAMEQIASFVAQRAFWECIWPLSWLASVIHARQMKNNAVNLTLINARDNRIIHYVTRGCKLLPAISEPPQRAPE
jgi:hypothetical protein